MAVSNQDIINFLLANPGMSDADIGAAMAQYGVSPSQMAQATGISEGEVTSRLAQTLQPNQATLFGDTYVQPIYTQLGSGMDAQQGPLENVVTYKANDNKVGGDINWYDPTGTYQQTTKQQEVNANSDFLKFLAGSAALFGGLGGGSLWGGAGTTAADAAAAAADADIAGGLIPEFGTNAAYTGFMNAAMTPEALAALEAIVAANPEIIGSGALLTDAAAGLTPTVTPTGSGSNVVTTTPTTPSTSTPAVTPTTPVTTATTPTVTATPTTTSVLPSAVTSVLPSVLTPSVITALGGLLGGTVLSKATGGTSSSSATPTAVPTQGIPLNSQDYFNAIQQNYNQIMPNMPRDVATPLANWYNSKYGA